MIQGFLHGERVSIQVAGLPPAPSSKPSEPFPAADFPRWAEPSPPEEREPSPAEVWRPGLECPLCHGVVNESKSERGLWKCQTEHCTWSWFSLKVT